MVCVIILGGGVCKNYVPLSVLCGVILVHKHVLCGVILLHTQVLCGVISCSILVLCGVNSVLPMRTVWCNSGRLVVCKNRIIYRV